MFNKIQIYIMNTIAISLLSLGFFGAYLYSQGRTFTSFQLACGVACIVTALLCYRRAVKVKDKMAWLENRKRMVIQSNTNWKVQRGLETRLDLDRRLGTYIDRRCQQRITEHQNRRIAQRRRRHNYTPHIALTVIGALMILLGTGKVAKNLNGQWVVSQVEGWVHEKAEPTTNGVKHHFIQLEKASEGLYGKQVSR